MNMAVPVNFFHRDRAFGSGLLPEAFVDFEVSAVPLLAKVAVWLALDSLAAAEAANTTAAKLVPVLIDGAVGTAKLFIEAK
jgi:hypothetical protein